MDKDDSMPNKPIAVYIPVKERRILEESLAEMGFDNIHQALQYGVLYFLKAWQKDRGIIQYETKPKKPDISK